ncbi:hypothetical protein [Marinobacterium litorale]|uniref:hypothetical protein n=1 Tax=Marinobacterium litorale TaxID=404770 RepID=UPI0003FB1A93|nr:hypothetical protein [Marinobacterium litorale]
MSELKPVAWLYEAVDESIRVTDYEQFAEMHGRDVTPLYAIPEGYALVPVEPTDAMVDAALACADDESIPEDAFAQSAYRAMITAAQEQEQ